MPREYRHIQEYEKEIMELRSQGKTGREIREKFGFSKKQYDNFINRYNRRQDKIAAGIVIRKKGRPAKDSVVTTGDKLADLRYKLARKEARIKQLEMENELMRNFLSLTGRK
ncbi:MAG: imidazolonepropionase [Clostridia bacterium]|nr:imidazolonepropionase [Clostridia bacterium]